MRRLGRRTCGDETGTTLVEMVVVMGLLAGLFSMTILLFHTTTRSVRHAQAETQDSQVTRAALDSMSKLLRTAVIIPTPGAGTPAFVSAGPSDVTFYSDIDTVTGEFTSGPPWKIRLYVDTTRGQLIEERTPGTNTSDPRTPFTWPSSDTRSRVLANHVSNPQPTRPDLTGTQPASGPIFTYLAKGDTTQGSLATDAGGNIMGTQLANINSVELWLTVRADPAAAPETSLTTRIFLPNMGDPDAVPASDGSPAT